MFFSRSFFAEICTKSLSITKRNNKFLHVKNHSTFHEWTLDYFRNQPNYNKFVLKQSMINVKKSVYNSIETVSTDELLLKFSISSVKPSHYEIDKELVNRINEMSINQIIALMDATLSRKNQLSKNSKAFQKCMEILDELWFRKPDLNVFQTIQLIYYVSIHKNKAKPIVESGLQKLMNETSYLKQLTDEELSILAVTTFKTNAKVYDKILRIFAFRLEKNLDKLIQNPLHFVSLLKPLKKAKYHDMILLNRITSTLMEKNNKVLKDVTSSIHFLAYLADSNYGSIKFLHEMINSIGNFMIEDNLKNYRTKDISSYIFSASYLGINPKDPIVCKIIVEYLDKMFSTKEKCQKYPKMLISMCLSMWMLDYKPIKLIKFLFSEVPISALRMSKAHKQDNRLNLLLSCVLIEQPDLLIHCQLAEETLNSMPDAQKHLGERPFLVKVYQTLQKLSHELDILNMEYNFSIPCLKILGIKIMKNNRKCIYVEILDNSNCLNNTQIPNGMMKLKFRLQSKLNFPVITVNSEDNLLHDPESFKCYMKSLMSQTQDISLIN